MSMSKRYTQSTQLIKSDQQYPVDEAIELAKQTSTVKFDASVEAHFRLNIDPAQTDQKIRFQIKLPYGTGKVIKVAAFVSPGNEQNAQNAGADLIGGVELVKKIKETKKTDFDVAVAEPSLMKSLAQVAKILGQRGLMPNPKTGTVGENIAELVTELKQGKVDVKTDDSGNIHQNIGKVSFDKQKLVDNFLALKEAIFKAKPSSVKREFISQITISTSMGPGIKTKK